MTALISKRHEWIHLFGQSLKNIKRMIFRSTYLGKILTKIVEKFNLKKCFEQKNAQKKWLSLTIGLAFVAVLVLEIQFDWAAGRQAGRIPVV